MFSYFWANQMSNVTVEIRTKSHAIVIQWFSYFCDACLHFLMETPIQNGGIGHSVQIDESLVATRIQV